MKLIPARCPSCGADIEVNKNNETAKCKYCDTRIIIDDAIAKYKIELQNMPTAKSYLKVGTRNLNAREFQKAHEQLEKALEIDPDNSEIIIKESLAKVLQKEITESNFNKILFAFRDAQEFCSAELLDELVSYSVELIEPNRSSVTSLIMSNPTKDVLTRMLFKYKFFINFYERLFRNYATKDETKKELIYKIFSTIQCYLNGGKYTTINQQGYYVTYAYKIPDEEINYLNNKKILYENELAKIDDEFRINLDKRRKAEAEREEEIRRIQEEKARRRKELKEKIFGKKADLIVDLIICALFFIIYICFIIEGLEYGYDIPPYVIFTFILFIPFFIFRIFKKVRTIPRPIIITSIVIRAIILYITILSLTMPLTEWLEKPNLLIGKTLTSLSNDTTIKIENDKVYIENTAEQTIEEYDYEYDYYEDELRIFYKENENIKEERKFKTYKKDLKVCEYSVYSEKDLDCYYHIKKDAK